MLEVIVLERGQVRCVRLDELRANGYHIPQTFAAGAADCVESADEGAVCDFTSSAAARAVELLLEQFERESPCRSLYRFVLHAIETRLIQDVLAGTRGNQLAAARQLGINRNTLRARIKRLGIQVPRKGTHAATAPWAACEQEPSQEHVS